VQSNSLVQTELENHRDITGSGFEIKLGTIFRPIEESPFRVGVYINSPVFYNLKSSNNSGLRLNGDYYDGSPRVDSYKYEFRTPWKFGFSLCHTIDNYLALGATYEYADYSTTDARIKDDSDYYYDEYNSESDDAMNAHVKKTLKGVSTLKLGAEYRPDENIAIRAGYNYVSPMYKQDASRGVDVWSLGNYTSSSTEYINWKDTHRFTIGIGFNLDKNLKLDAAYQYSMQKGQFLPFAGSDDDNLPFDKEVDFKRNQWMLTLTYNM
jgi:long-subunit fatty acid transport protein